MKYHHGWSLEELENMLPWELDIYVNLTTTAVAEENERIKNSQSSGGGMPNINSMMNRMKR